MVQRGDVVKIVGGGSLPTRWIGKEVVVRTVVGNVSSVRTYLTGECPPDALGPNLYPGEFEPTGQRIELD